MWVNPTKKPIRVVTLPVIRFHFRPKGPDRRDWRVRRVGLPSPVCYPGSIKCERPFLSLVPLRFRLVRILRPLLVVSTTLVLGWWEFYTFLYWHTRTSVDRVTWYSGVTTVRHPHNQIVDKEVTGGTSKMKHLKSRSHWRGCGGIRYESLIFKRNCNRMRRIHAHWLFLLVNIFWYMWPEVLVRVY